MYTYSNTFNHGDQNDRLGAEVSVLSVSFYTGDNTPLIVKDTPAITLQMPRRLSDTPAVDNAFNFTELTNMTSAMHWVNNTQGDEVLFVTLVPSPYMEVVESYVVLVRFESYPTETEYDHVYVFSGNVTCSGMSV